MLIIIKGCCYYVLNPFKVCSVFLVINWTNYLYLYCNNNDESIRIHIVYCR